METPQKQRLMGWRGDMPATTSAGSQLNEWAGLTPDQEALLGALQVRYHCSPAMASVLVCVSIVASYILKQHASYV